MYANLLFQQLISQYASGEHAKEVEELSDGYENVPGADQVVLRDHRVVVGLVLELGARNYVGVAVQRFLPHARLLVTVLVVVIVMGVLLCILVDIAEVNAKLLIVALLLLRMRDLDPLRLVLGSDCVGGLQKNSPCLGAGAVKMMQAINQDDGILHRKISSTVRSCHFPHGPVIWPTASTLVCILVFGLGAFPSS